MPAQTALLYSVVPLDALLAHKSRCAVFAGSPRRCPTARSCDQELRGGRRCISFGRLSRGWSSFVG